MVNLIITLLGIALVAATALISVSYVDFSTSVIGSKAAEAQALETATLMKNSIRDLSKVSPVFTENSFETELVLDRCPSGRDSSGEVVPQFSQKVKVDVRGNEKCLAESIFQILPTKQQNLQFMFDLEGKSILGTVPSVSWRWIRKSVTGELPDAAGTVGDYAFNSQLGVVCLRPDLDKEKGVQVANISGRALKGVIEAVKQLNGGGLSCSGISAAEVAANCEVTSYIYFIESTSPDEISCYDAIGDLNSKAENDLESNEINDGEFYKAVFAVGV